MQGARCYSTLYSHYRPCYPYLEKWIGVCVRVSERNECPHALKLSRPVCHTRFCRVKRRSSSGEIRENKEITRLSVSFVFLLGKGLEFDKRRIITTLPYLCSEFLHFSPLCFRKSKTLINGVINLVSKQ